MLKNLKQIILALLVGFVVTQASANGGMWETPFRASANVLIQPKRFALEREELEIKLNATNYETKVTYFLTDSVGSSSASQTTMYFPVLCSHQDGAEKSKECVNYFRVYIDGKLTTSSRLSHSEVMKSKVLFSMAQKINTRTKLKSGEADDWGFSSSYVFYTIALPPTSVKTLTVEYQADYAQELSGTSKSPSTSYSPARMVYDFLPAAGWAGSNVTELKIELDTSNMKSPLFFNKQLWPFVFHENRGTLTVRQPDFSKLPPLELTTRNGNFQEFTSIMNTLNISKTRYQVSEIKVHKADDGRNEINALFDRNPATFWCWRGKTATLLLRVDPEVVVEDVAASKRRPAPYRVISLQAIGLINGAAKNKMTFENYGMARNVTIQSKDASSAALGIKKQYLSLSRTKVLPLLVMKGEIDSFRSHTLVEHLPYFQRDDRLKSTPESSLTAADYRKRIKPIEYILKIEDVHKKVTSDESCISEIYPVYSD